MYLSVVWCMPVIPVLKSQRQGNSCKFKAGLSCNSEFGASQGCMARLCSSSNRPFTKNPCFRAFGYGLRPIAVLYPEPLKNQLAPCVFRTGRSSTNEERDPGQAHPVMQIYTCVVADFNNALQAPSFHIAGTPFPHVHTFLSPQS